MITVDVGGREVARVGPGESAYIRGDDGRLLVRITDSGVAPHPMSGSEAWVKVGAVLALLEHQQVGAVLALLAHQQREQGKELAALHPDCGGYCKTCGGTFPCVTRRLADQWVGPAQPGAVEQLLPAIAAGVVALTAAIHTVNQTLSCLRRVERIVEGIADRLGVPIPPTAEEDST